MSGPTYPPRRMHLGCIYAPQLGPNGKFGFSPLLYSDMVPQDCTFLEEDQGFWKCESEIEIDTKLDVKFFNKKKRKKKL